MVCRRPVSGFPKQTGLQHKQNINLVQSQHPACFLKLSLSNASVPETQTFQDPYSRCAPTAKRSKDSEASNSIWGVYSMPLSLAEILPTNTFWVLWSASAGYHRGQGARSPAKKCRLTKATLTLTSGHLASYPHLLVTLLLRYRLRNQSRLTCKHVAVQVQRWEVVAWRKQKGDKKEKDQVSPLHTATLPRGLSGAEDTCEQRLCDSLL